ncbi:hypothetical protein Ait01nite_070090 [Actinoplanes italicus]|uniref:Uncharacterized protein n=1 Tax=Actinoplanes italicus TaxID=113567 RepID=A0A2T0JV06_9ACTN|nr:hypothetical protein [Actinoplanes italicus]PRX11507.1 hypothetical protein CLV67_13183 [Actinoplanes italicus]GIE33964.1 hypothetical protein Ait01nite_070090 [Actinoplanes italicus]
MVTFAPVDLPVCEPGFQPDKTDDQIRDWVTSEPIRELVSAYGGSLPDTQVEDVLLWLDDFSGEHWDFRRRGGVERDQVTAPEFDEATADLILAAARALRLVDAAQPAHSSYDHILVLGGLGRACLQRTRYAADIVKSGAATAPELAALGSFRPLNAAETALPELAGATYEVDAMDAGVRIAFGLDEPADRAISDGDVTHSSWEVRTYSGGAVPEIHVLAAPSSEPDTRRANTPDTYEFWANRVQLQTTDRILVVTSPIYVPFQHSDAIRMLGMRYGCGLDTIGFDPARVTVPLAPGATNPDRYLQEIRSGILSMLRLHNALTDPAKTA